MSLANAGFSGTMFSQGSGIIGMLVGGYLSDKVARRLVSQRMLFQSCSYFITVPFFFTFAMSSGYVVIGSSIFISSFVWSIGQANAAPILCEVVPFKMQSTAFGLLNTANCVAGGVGILLAGYVKQKSILGSMFAGVSGTVAVAGGLLLIGYRYVLANDIDSASQIYVPELDLEGRKIF